MRKVTKRDKIIAAVILLLVVALLAAATFLFILPELRSRETAEKKKKDLERWVPAFVAYRECVIGKGKAARTLAMRSNEVEYESINRACAKKVAAALVDAPAAVKTLITSRLSVHKQGGCQLIRQAHEALTTAATDVGLSGPDGLPPTCLKVPAPSERTPEHLRVWKPKRTWVADGWLHALVVGLRRCGGRTFAARSLDGQDWQKIKLDPCYSPTRVVAWEASRLVGVFFGRKPGEPRPACCVPKVAKGKKKRRRRRRRRRRRSKNPAADVPAPLFLLTYKDKQWQRVARLPKGHIPKRVVLGQGGEIYVEGERRVAGRNPVFEVLRYTEGKPGVQLVRPVGGNTVGPRAAVNTAADGSVVAAVLSAPKLAVLHVAANARRRKPVKLPALPAPPSKDATITLCRAKKALWLLAGKSLLVSGDGGASFKALPALDRRYKLAACDDNNAVVSGDKRIRVCTRASCAGGAELRAEARGVDLRDGVVRVCTKAPLASVALRYVTKPKPSFRAKLLVASCDRLEWAWKQSK